MVSIVPSRFAGLKIEDDDEEEETRPKKSNKNQNKSKAGQQQTPANQNGKQGNKVCNKSYKCKINKRANPGNTLLVFRTKNQIRQKRKSLMA